MDQLELHNRFAYHPATTKDIVRAHEEVRDNCADLAQWLNDQLPEGREKALAMTHLEEVMMWANAAIARSQHAPAGENVMTRGVEAECWEAYQ